MPNSNASLLDEATAASEAFALSYSVGGGCDIFPSPSNNIFSKKKIFYIDEKIHPQTKALVETHAAYTSK